MASFILTNQEIFFDGYELTGESNAIAVNYSAESKNATVFGNDTRVMKGGLKTVEIQIEGFYDATAVDAGIFPNIGVAGKLITISGQGNSVGDFGYFMNALAGNLNYGDSVGELLKYSLGAGARGPLVRGQLLANQAYATTTNGTSVQVGSAVSSQTVYAGLHVTASSGSGDQTLDVTIESDDNSGMSTSVTRFTFPQVTTDTSGQYLTLAGPVSDDYWRAVFTVAGTGSPSFTAAVILGVL